MLHALYHPFSGLQLMFKLMDRVPDGIVPMLKDLEDHIVNAGLAEMIAAADIITQVKQNINL
jgi:cullin-5